MSLNTINLSGIKMQPWSHYQHTLISGINTVYVKTSLSATATFKADPSAMCLISGLTEAMIVRRSHALRRSDRTYHLGSVDCLPKITLLWRNPNNIIARTWKTKSCLTYTNSRIIDSPCTRGLHKSS